MVMSLAVVVEGVQAVASRCKLLFLWFVFGLWRSVLIEIFLYSKGVILEETIEKNSLNDVIFDFQHLTLNPSFLATATWTLVLLDVLSFGRCNIDALTLNNFFKIFSG